MKYALVDGQRQEASPGLAGECPGCGSPMMAKCGEARAWHWAHRGRRHCDVWWENETQWHRDWKGQFPDEWQEIVHHAEDGERHIADVKTDRHWVIEFQHSYIKPPERRAREAFYPNLIWVVDGKRRKRDEAGLHRAWNEASTPFGPNAPIRELWPHDGALLKEWAGSSGHVFFDLGDEQVLWWLLPNASDHQAYVVRISRASFTDTHRGTVSEDGGDFDRVADEFVGLVEDYQAHRKRRQSQGVAITLPHPRTRRRRSSRRGRGRF